MKAGRSSITANCRLYPTKEDLNRVTWEQRVIEGDPKLEASQRIPDVACHRFAELIGLKGIFVDRPHMVGPAWEAALAADRPVLIEFKTDPDVPPLPPHITTSRRGTWRLPSLTPLWSIVDDRKRFPVMQPEQPAMT